MRTLFTSQAFSFWRLDNDPKDIPPTDDYDDGLVDNETAAIDIYDPNFFKLFFSFGNFHLVAFSFVGKHFVAQFFF